MRFGLGSENREVLHGDFANTQRLCVKKRLQLSSKRKEIVKFSSSKAIANTAGFHMPTIEQGGNSRYPSLAQRVTSVEVLRILISIGPTETMHFQTWSDKAGNAPPLTDPRMGWCFRTQFPSFWRGGLPDQPDHA